ncbi:MAG: hypothetical protein ACJAVK_003660, partial [Akkermansiaceae bacterium]
FPSAAARRSSAADPASGASAKAAEFESEEASVMMGELLPVFDAMTRESSQGR